jgi:hypothetical protein
VSNKQSVDDPQQARPPAKQATFRMPRTAIVAAVIAMISGTPFAWSSPYLATVYLVPIGFIVWMLRNQTTVDEDGLAARSTFGTKVIRWDELKGLALTGRAKVRAVLADEPKVALPGVRTRHLPVLAAFSGGRIADPTKPADDPAPAKD